MASQINPGSMIAISATLPTLSIIAVCSRFYIRLSHNQGLCVDDWLIIPALLMIIGIGIAIIIGVKQHAVGYPAGTNDFAFLNWSLSFCEQLDYAIFLMGALNFGLVKLSLLYFYRRIFYTGVNRGFKITTNMLSVVVVCWTVSVFFAQMFSCGSNISLRWASYAAALENCINGEAINLFWAGSDVLLDIILFVLPIPMILGLQMSTGRRLAILLVFAVGALAVVASIIRLVIYSLLYSGNQTDDFIGGDILIAISLSFYWILFEAGIAIIVVCLPVLQVWFRKVSVDAVAKNVLGILSVQPLSRGSKNFASRGKGSHPISGQNLYSSESHLNDPNHSIELRASDGYYRQDEESQTRRD